MQVKRKREKKTKHEKTPPAPDAHTRARARNNSSTNQTLNKSPEVTGAKRQMSLMHTQKSEFPEKDTSSSFPPF